MEEGGGTQRFKDGGRKGWILLRGGARGGGRERVGWLHCGHMTHLPSEEEVGRLMEGAGGEGRGSWLGEREREAGIRNN